MFSSRRSNHCMRKQQLLSSGRSPPPRLCKNRCHSRWTSRCLLSHDISSNSICRRVTRRPFNSRLHLTIGPISIKLRSSHNISNSLLRRSNKAAQRPRLANKHRHRTSSNPPLKLLGALQARPGWITIAWDGVRGRNRGAMESCYLSIVLGTYIHPVHNRDSQRSDNPLASVASRWWYAET